jgi:hypothetical protein
MGIVDSTLRKRLPPEGHNNFWWINNKSATVIVFVHGIFSDSRSCWLRDDLEALQYWPDLISKDSRLGNPSIFLGGFYTDWDSGKYSIADCAKELYAGLTVPDADQNHPPIEKRQILFICHSTGGIVVRYMLAEHVSRFADKRIGLMLYASPSFGSKLATTLGGLAHFYGNQLGKNLAWGDDLLSNIDDRFKTLINDKQLPKLNGIEACENHFVMHHKFLPDRTLVVEELSAGRYFALRRLGATNHFTTVKPSDEHHPAHKLLVEFWLGMFGPSLEQPTYSLLESSRVAMKERDLPYYTPSLLLALLYPGGFGASALNAVKPGLSDALRTSLVDYVENQLPHLNVGGFKDFDWYDRPDIQNAQKQCIEECQSLVNERHVFAAILRSESQAVQQLKAQMGQDFDRLLQSAANNPSSLGATPGLLSF